MGIIAWRTVLLYGLIILAIRVMGKRQIGDMQPGELVVTFLISDLAASPILNQDEPLWEGIIPIALLVLLEWLVSKVILKSLLLRKGIDGHTEVLIRNGEVDQKKLRDLRITVDDLMELMRSEGVFDIEAIAYGLLETNGQFSVLLKAEEQPLTPKTARGDIAEATFPVPVITDGRYRKSQMAYLGLSPRDVDGFLVKHGVSRQEVFLLTVDEKGNSSVIKKSR